MRVEPFLAMSSNDMFLPETVYSEAYPPRNSCVCDYKETPDEQHLLTDNSQSGTDVSLLRYNKFPT